MNNLEQGSTSNRLAQSASIPQDSAVHNLSYEDNLRLLEQLKRSKNSRLREPQAPQPSAQVAELLQPTPAPTKKRWQPAKPIRKDISGPIALLGSKEAVEAHLEAQRPQQRQQPPALEELLDLEALRPKRGKGAGGEGAAALARELDHLARIALDARIYLYSADGAPPEQIVMHLPAEAIGERLGVSPDTLNRHTARLTELGYLQARPHYTSTTDEGEVVSHIDGTLYAVRLAPGRTAKLTKRDYKRKYRDLDADKAAGRTAFNLIKNAYTKAGEKPRQDEEKKCGGQDQFCEGYETIRARLTPTQRNQARLDIAAGLELWAVTPGHISAKQAPLLNNDPRIYFANITAGLTTVQDVIYSVGILADCAYKIRSDLVAAFARVLAREFDNGYNHPAWCGLLWEAYRREKGGLHGLDDLRRVLTRTMVTVRERGKDIRKPGAMCFKAWRNEVGGPSTSELASAAD